MSHLDLINPFSGESLGSYQLESFESQKDKISKLKLAQKTWSQQEFATRLSLVKDGLQYFEKNRKQIAMDLCEQMGRPLKFADGEINGFFERANYLCSIAEQTLASDVFNDKAGFERSIEHVPLGIIFVISAWNYPLLITVNSVIPALIAGNTVLLKHSGLTPKIGIHFENAFKKLGDFDNLLFNSILTHETTGKIIEELPIDHVIFTGSVKGGHEIMKHAGKTFLAPALELGGKDGAYVHEDANIDYAAETLVDGAMFNSGQSCCGIERVYVHEKIYEQFINKVKEAMSGYVLGDPKDENTNLGPLASARSADYMLDQIKDAKVKGANIILGGDKELIEKGTFFQPTLLTNVSHAMNVMKEENFGPILPIMKVSGVDEAITLINDSDYGLTSCVFTHSKEIATQVAKQADTGTVFMNRCDYLDPALPWTGVKNSGRGSALSKYGFHNVTRRKSIHFKTNL